ncbi:MAG: hypothetical protein ACUVX9_00740 [Anaerolineae bacterium]
MAASASRYRRMVGLAAILVCMLLLSAILLALAECAASVSDPRRNRHAPAVAAAATCLAAADCAEVRLSATTAGSGPGTSAGGAPVSLPSSAQINTNTERGAVIRLIVLHESCAGEGQGLDLWTVVQWQDTGGGWHDVQGWQGWLDGESKTWWVAPQDLGTGPFRWVVYHGRCGAVAGASGPFLLPNAPDQVVEARVVLR